MKYFFFGFTTFFIVVCITFLIVNFGTGQVDSNSHLHLDVLISTFNESFNEYKQVGLIDRLNELGIKDGDLAGALYGVAAWLVNSIVQLLYLIRAVVQTILTPCIF